MKSYILILSLLFVLFGCSDDQNGDTLNGKSNSLSVASVSTQNVQTRSTTPLKKDSIGVFLRPGNGYVEQANVKYRYNASSSAWETLAPLYLGSHNASVCAYYPYSSSVTDAQVVPLVSKEYTSESDFCYAANQPASSSAPKVSFTMKHAYARISFHITRGASYAGSSAINYISIKNDSLCRSVMLNIAEGTYANPALGTFSFDPKISGIVSGKTEIKQVLLVPVNVVLGKITFTFKIDGEIMSTNADVASYGLNSLTAGYDYKVSITISGSSLSLNGVSVSDWTDESSIDSDMRNDVQPESNCYMVKPNSYINIPVSRAKWNPSTPTLPTSWTTGLVWTDYPNPLTSSGTIEKIIGNVNGSIITVKTGSAEGNAVIYMKNSSNVIIWSWHIWVTNYDPNSANYGYNNYVWMNRNLGATSSVVGSDSYGLLYQWGRKDPFPSAARANSTYNDKGAVTFLRQNSAPGLLAAIENPFTFYGYTGSPWDWYSTNINALNNALWGGASLVTPSAKTVYDPCPQGWRVPAYKNSVFPWSGLSTSGATFNVGYTWATVGFYPAAGYLHEDSRLYVDVGSVGYYWCASATTVSSAAYLYFKSGTISETARGRGCGMSVRCVKE